MCDFCNELSGADRGEFGRRHPTIHNRTVWVNSDLAVLPTLGPLTRGHSLIVPREHFTACASMPAPVRRQVEDLVLDCATRERAAGRDLLWFEHGAAAPGSSGGCGIVHAHLHLIPTPSGWNRPVLPSEIVFGLANPRRWLDTPAPDTDYLLVGQVDNVCVASIDWVPSQMLRRWLAPSLGAAQWDWRESDPEPVPSLEPPTCVQPYRSVAHERPPSSRDGRSTSAPHARARS
jgi:diadenosine tetraphosphate (Ap4A) HIT family hydrolase